MHNLFIQFGTVQAGQIFTYTVPDSYRMTDQNVSIEEKAQYIHASDEIVVYASNKQVGAKMNKLVQYLKRRIVNTVIPWQVK